MSKASHRRWLKAQREEDKALQALNAAHPVVRKPTVSKMLRASNEYFTAGAVFMRVDGFWKVTQCAPILGWMRKTPLDRIPLELLKRGCRWDWSPVIERDKSSADLLDTSAGKDLKHTAYETLTALGSPTAGEGGTLAGSFTDCVPATLALQR